MLYDPPERAIVNPDTDYFPQRRAFYKEREALIGGDMKEAIAAAITNYSVEPDFRPLIAAIRKEGVSQPLLEMLAVGDGYANQGGRNALALCIN